MVVRIAVAICFTAAIVALAEMLRAYRGLPERMPLHFGLRGIPGTSGPKLAFAVILTAIEIWMCVSIGAGSFADAPSARAAARHAAIVTAAAAVFTAYMQHAIIVATMRRAERLPMTGVWIAFAIFLAFVFVGDVN